STNKTHDLFLATLTDNIADHCRCRSCKGPRENSKQPEDIPHSIRNSESALTVVFNQNVKELPRHNADCELSDQRGRLDENQFGKSTVPTNILEQRKRPVEPLYVNHRKDGHESCKLSNDRRIRSAVETQLRESELSVDKTVVQNDICDSLRQRAPDQQSRAIGSHQEGVAHHIQIQDRETPDADVEKIDRHFGDCGIVNRRPKDGRSNSVGYSNSKPRNSQCYPDTMKKKATDICRLILTRTSRDQSL